MGSNSWISFSSVFSSSSSSSRRYQSRSDLYLGEGYEDVEGEGDLKAEFICPFCGEYFDIVGLCCHIDEDHPIEAKNGVCPVCTKRVGLDIVGHITMQHGSLFRVQRRRRLRRGGYSSAYLALKKELQEAYLQSLEGSSKSLTNIDSDPLLSSFMSNSPAANESLITSMTAGASNRKPYSWNLTLERDIREARLSGKDREKGRKCEFVHGLMLSAMFDEEI